MEEPETWVAGKIRPIEGEQGTYSVKIHGGHEPGVVRGPAADAVFTDEPLPLFVESRWVQKQRKGLFHTRDHPKRVLRSRPRPLLAWGRVQTDQSSYRFCGTTQRTSPRSRSACKASRATRC